MAKKFTFFIIILCAAFFLFSYIQIPALILENTQVSQIVFIHKISPNDTFTMHWMHSVELEPWEEIFRIDEDYHIILDHTRFKAFGAGVPADAGQKTMVKDGWIYFLEINQPIPNLTYGISHIAKHTFYFKDKAVKLYQEVPKDAPVSIYLQKTSLITYGIKKIRMLLF
ncbi:DUF1850 domain-containing protein [Clostridiaceae bacterium 35-E11]